MCLFVFGFDIVCCIFGIVCSVLILPPSLTGVWFLGFGILPPSSAPKPHDVIRSTRIATFERRKAYQRRQCVTTASPILGYPAAFTGKYSTFPPIIPHHRRKHCHGQNTPQKKFFKPVSQNDTGCSYLCGVIHQ